MLPWHANWLAAVVLLAGACAWQPGHPPRYEVDRHACESLAAADAEPLNVQGVTESEPTRIPVEDATARALVFASDTSGAATMRIEPEVAGMYGMLTTHAVTWSVWSAEDGFVPVRVVDVVGCDAVVQGAWFALHPEPYQVHVTGAPEVLHLLTVVLAEPESEAQEGHDH